MSSPSPFLPFSRAPVPCAVEGPSDYLPKAHYAVEMLLLGLGLAPRWTDREGLAEGGLYYGPAPEAAPEAALRLRLAPATADFFARRQAFDPARMGALVWDGAAWPLPFDGGDGGEAESVIATSVVEKDVVASAFFWLAGWPERTSTARDAHGRYPFSGSLHDALGLALVPAVDAYRRWLGARMAARGVNVPGRRWGGCGWAVALTVDVDYVRTHRPGALVRALASGRLDAARRALASGDPRRTALERLAALAADHAGATFFVKAGASAPEDVAYRLDAPRVRRFLDALQSDGAEVGLHPSYAAFDHAGRLAEERDRLAAHLGRAPEVVRTHYLRWREPATPRLLDAAGFRLDSTLGFARREGFRRATCHPFRLFDLDANRPLDLWELPLAVMDTTLFTHRGLTPEAAEAQIQAVLGAVRRVGGCAVLLWHNDPGGGAAPEPLARLARTLSRARSDGALVTGLQGALEAWRPASP